MYATLHLSVVLICVRATGRVPLRDYLALSHVTKVTRHYEVTAGSLLKAGGALVSWVRTGKRKHLGTRWSLSHPTRAA